MRRITIVFFDAGGGHRNAAEALKAVLESPEHGWQLSLLNLQELLDSIDFVRGVTGIRTQDAYNLILRKGWTRLSPQLLPLLQGLIRLKHQAVVKLLQEQWKAAPADLVLSVIPHFNRAMAESIRETMPSAAFVTLITDFADYPPHFWMEKESEYVICGTEKARQQALALGLPEERVFLTSGMILKPKFYQQIPIDRRTERKRLGLDPDVPTGVVLFGGHGSPAMVQIAKQVDQIPSKVQLIMLCGHSRKILEQLRKLRLNKRMVLEGFTSSVDYYMALADFFIGKPGPGSISEALQFHLPVIVECNARTMPQERYNTEWLLENRMGIVLSSFRKSGEGVEQLLTPETFAELRRNAAAYKNRALLEVPEMLERIVAPQNAQPTAVLAGSH
jgi:1,2-diacylglycerol 3-beta-galactosyltransferase